MWYCDLRIIGFDATLWYSAVQDRGGWYDACQTFASRSVPTASGPVAITGSFVCECGRIFRRRGDLTRHQNFFDITSYGVYMQLWTIFWAGKEI